MRWRKMKPGTARWSARGRFDGWRQALSRHIVRASTSFNRHVMNRDWYYSLTVASGIAASRNASVGGNGSLRSDRNSQKRCQLSPGRDPSQTW